MTAAFRAGNEPNFVVEVVPVRRATNAPKLRGALVPVTPFFVVAPEGAGEWRVTKLLPVIAAWWRCRAAWETALLAACNAMAVCPPSPRDDSRVALAAREAAFDSR